MPRSGKYPAITGSSRMDQSSPNDLNHQDETLQPLLPIEDYSIPKKTPNTSPCHRQNQDRNRSRPYGDANVGTPSLLDPTGGLVTAMIPSYPASSNTVQQFSNEYQLPMNQNDDGCGSVHTYGNPEPTHFRINYHNTHDRTEQGGILENLLFDNITRKGTKLASDEAIDPSSTYNEPAQYGHRTSELPNNRPHSFNQPNLHFKSILTSPQGDFSEAWDHGAATKHESPTNGYHQQGPAHNNPQQISAAWPGHPLPKDYQASMDGRSSVEYAQNGSSALNNIRAMNSETIPDIPHRGMPDTNLTVTQPAWDRNVRSSSPQHGRHALQTAGLPRFVEIIYVCCILANLQGNDKSLSVGS
ncbi:hypothetical protein BKA66DRAFT_569059 [Pyrenochaeta sp. MPI-SDFR-AT-0127]|nr:hypothetical protein BKA66DRAFT_569059 [Pyrenochaeta sp. MPI-SDFR-AT-0127]